MGGIRIFYFFGFIFFLDSLCLFLLEMGQKEQVNIANWIVGSYLF